MVTRIRSFLIVSDLYVLLCRNGNYWRLLTVLLIAFDRLPYWNDELEAIRSNGRTAKQMIVLDMNKIVKALSNWRRFIVN